MYNVPDTIRKYVSYHTLHGEGCINLFNILFEPIWDVQVKHKSEKYPDAFKYAQWKKELMPKSELKKRIELLFCGVSEETIPNALVLLNEYKDRLSLNTIEAQRLDYALDIIKKGVEDEKQRKVCYRERSRHSLFS